MEIDELFPIAETLQLLRFAELAEGDLRLTEAGNRFVRGDPTNARSCSPASGYVRAARGAHQARTR